jgi:hypothetical protein
MSTGAAWKGAGFPLKGAADVACTVREGGGIDERASDSGGREGDGFPGMKMGAVERDGDSAGMAGKEGEREPGRGRSVGDGTDVSSVAGAAKGRA